MRAIRISLFYFIFCFSALGQRTDVSVCRGSTSVNKNVSYSLNFLGKKKLDALNLFGYCNFPNISNNYIWLNFTPNSYGNLEFIFGDKPDSLTIFIFECKTNDPCAEIIEKRANLILCDFTDKKINPHEVKPVFLTNNSSYFIAFNTTKGSTSKLDFTIKFEESDQFGAYLEDSLSLNLVSRYDQPIYALH